MKKAAIVAVVLFASLSVVQTCLAGGYVKLGDIKGESDQSGAPHSQRLQQQPPKTRGLLLPAVQKARLASEKMAKQSGAKGGKVETTWKVEKAEK